MTGRLVAVLALAGYHLDFRTNVFTEVLVSNEAERWLGCGTDPAAALSDALTRMFPSALSRTLWLAHHEGLNAAAAVESTPTDTPEVPSEPGPAPEPEPAPIVTAPPEPALPKPAPVLTSTSPAPSVPLTPRMDPLGAVHDVLQEFTETTDLALFAPHVMRLQLLAWMAAARDAQDTAGAGESVEHVVTKLAAAFGDVARTYWPGSVPALARSATPSSVTNAARSWRDVVVATERLLATSNVTATGRPVDGYGWLDGVEARLEPLPAQPHVHIRAAQALIESWFGRTILGPAVPAPGTSSVRDVYYASLAAASEDMGPLHKAAALLRWCRTSTDTPQVWGQLMGWLRWIEWERRDSQLDNYLSPFYDPGKSWAECAGFNLRREVARPSVPAPTEDVIPWLRQHAQDMDQVQLHQHLYPFRGLLARLDDTGELNTELSGGDLRSLRSKLRKLLRRNFEGTSAPAANPVAAPEPAEQDVAAPETFGGAGPILEARARVEGQRTLMVSNREDPHLRRQLTEGLGIDIVDWAIVDKTAALAAKANAIQQGCYDLVLIATGFLSHSREGVILDACRTSGIPYVRAGKCRLTGCALAILSHGIGA